MNELNDFLPKNDLNEQEIFVQFKNKLLNPKIHNIGIVGRYGAGKSSFINSFFEWFKRNRSEKTYDYQVSVCDNKNGKIEVFNASLSNSIVNISNDSDYTYKVKTKKDKICIENRKKCKKEKEPLFITLGNLYSDKSTDVISIEKCILRQIVYSVNSFELPDSRINRIDIYNSNRQKENNIWKYFFFISAFLFAFSFITFCVFRYSPLVTHVIFHILTEPVTIDIEKNIYSSLNNLVRTVSFRLILIAGGVTLFSAVKAGYIRTLIEKIANPEIDKVTTKHLKVNLSDKNEKSIFGRYIDEILYYFIQTNTKIVVFEDIDRFCKEEVFLHLKELNHILNNYACHNNLEKITFIYAVKEDLFETDKTNNLLSIVKFFDFCMPIIPFGNRLNIGNMLIQLKNKNLSEERYARLNDEILIKLGSLIDETRLYTNIINEYEVYNYKLKDNPCLNYQELFSLLVIKNVDLKSFIFLESGSENIYQLFKLKDKLIEIVLSEKKTIKDDIDAKEQELNQIIDTEVKNIQEKYLTGFAKEFPGNCNNLTDVRGLKVEYPDAMKTLIDKGYVKIDEDFDEQGTPECSQSISIDKDVFSNFIINGRSYESELNSFLNSEFILEKKDTIASEKEEYQDEIDFLSSAFFYELIQKYHKEIKKIEDENEKIINKEKAIYEYIKDGILTENYANCISYFMDGILSRNDQIFINYVKNNVGNSIELQLCRFNEILKELSEKESYNSIIINDKVLNYSLFNYLCKNRLKSNNSKVLSDLISYIFTKKKDEFMFNCINMYSENKYEILLSIFLYGENIFYSFVNKYYNKDEQIVIFKNILSYDFGHSIYHMNDQTIINFIKNNREFLLNEKNKKNISILLKNK